MRPPRLLVLQSFNALVGAGSYLVLTAATSTWTAGGWDSREVGFGGMAANLCYAAFVAQGGSLSDRWGRARTAILGALLCIVGGAMALAVRDPAWTCAGLMVAFVGTAFFFPGNVGLFSDAQKENAGPPPPLHVKVASYNIGWSGGNLIGFGSAWLLSVCGLPIWSAFVIAMVTFVTVTVALWRWRNLPPSPPPADGDRADHPALPRLTLMARVALGLYCCMGMSFIGLLENSLVQQGVEQTRAHSLAVAGLTAYALGYVTTFWFYGRWSGWILRPWIGLAMQGGVLLAGLLVLAIGELGWHGTPAIFACGLTLGFALGAVYTPSIYYSLRLPVGAARAASLHETALGIGSTVGPALAGLFIAWFLSARPGAGLSALGSWMLIVAAAVLGWQALLIPGARRLGAR